MALRSDSVASCFTWSLLLVLLPDVLGSSDTTCGLTYETERSYKDGSDFVFSWGGDPDIEDALSGLDSLQDYKTLKDDCSDKKGKLHQGGFGEDCINFGVKDWNLLWEVMSLEGRHLEGKLPCKGDLAAVKSRMGDSSSSPRCGEVFCNYIDKIRIVGVIINSISAAAGLSTLHLPYLTHARFDLKYLPGLEEAGISLPATLRTVIIRISDEEGAALWPAFAALLRAQGKIEFVYIEAPYYQLHWVKLDLALLCGLNLRKFGAYTINVGETLPECWSGMKQLESFYCTNCMMTKPPTALKGLLSLRSFVAFRQSEMIACAVGKLSKAPEHCRPSWETRKHRKPKQESTGTWDDFQEGPSFLCPDMSYSFPLKDLVDLGWSNIEKVWLDGNFLSGRIPENIGELWPKLRSLDLYDNNLEGPIPESLGKLNWIKLQLHSNNFSGRVPASVMKVVRNRIVYFGVGDNPLLEGCIPKNDHDIEEFMGTRQIRLCDDEDEL
eukprot:TRINITY_DN7016_c0_g1_i13.p1 TRINITY_DN7016_c0_g1~~TRINITY_DN7016_c0_g1_i13.p1  ORF type:complete len:496 (-),score=55.70 TRINITY_DN7016_c0_g1_i13:136-1623(-)